MMDNVDNFLNSLYYVNIVNLELIDYLFSYNVLGLWYKKILRKLIIIS